MKCKYCVSEGKSSKLFPQGSSRTCMGWSAYWDEFGVYHSHDPNIVATSYRCSNGHVFHEAKKSPCPACGSDW